MGSWLAIAQHDGGVAHRLGERARLVERGGERDDAPARAAPVGRLDADGAGQRGGLADGAAGVGGGGSQAQVGGHRGRRSRRRSRPAPACRRLPSALAPPRVDDGAEGAGLVGGAHGELVAVELAEHHRAGVPQVGVDGRFVGRLEVVEDLRAGRGAHALGAEQSLMPSGSPSRGRASAGCPYDSLFQDPR